MDQSQHFRDMVQERNIDLAWVDRAVGSPDRIEDREDGTRHFLKRTPEWGNRWLRVVVNTAAEPNRAVTAFFDRRLESEP